MSLGVQPAFSLSLPLPFNPLVRSSALEHRFLPEEEHPIRFIATVDVAVAVAASTTQHIRGVRETQSAAGSRAMHGAVAFVAQPRTRHFQQIFVVRAVRLVAVQAVLTHRRVFPQHRTALFSMTLVAILVHRSLADQLVRNAAMWVMAIRASQLALANRHVGRVLHLCPLELVALEAGLGLDLGLQILLARHVLHHSVAVGAGDTARFVNAAGPVIAFALLMAGETDAVSFLDRARIVTAERQDAADAASAAGLHVRRPWSVAVLAFKLALLRPPD